MDYLARTLKGKANFGSLDVTKNKYLEKEFNIKWFPITWFFDKDCKKIDCGTPVDYFMKGDSFEYWVYKQVDELDEKEETDMEDVYVLTTDNFDDLVFGTQGESWLVYFYAPWCKPCKTLKPDFKEFATLIAERGKVGKGIVKCGLMNSDEHTEIGQRMGIVNYPTVYLYPLDKKTDSGRILSKGGFGATDLDDFVRENLDPEASDVVILTDANFDELVYQNDEEDWFIEFYAPWCGHCKKLKPEWEELATKMRRKVKIGKVDATANKKLEKRFNIEFFPTLKLFKKGLNKDAKAIAHKGT